MAYKSSGVYEEYLIDKYLVLYRYLNTRFALSIYPREGFCMNLANLYAAKEISGRVIELGYMIDPTSS